MDQSGPDPTGEEKRGSGTHLIQEDLRRQKTKKRGEDMSYSGDLI